MVGSKVFIFLLFLFFFTIFTLCIKARNYYLLLLFCINGAEKLEVKKTGHHYHLLCLCQVILAAQVGSGCVVKEENKSCMNHVCSYFIRSHIVSVESSCKLPQQCFYSRSKPQVKFLPSNIHTLQLSPNSWTLLALVPSGFIQSFRLCPSKFPHRPPTFLLYMRGRMISAGTKSTHKMWLIHCIALWILKVPGPLLIPLDLFNEVTFSYLLCRVHQTPLRGQSQSSGRCERNAHRFLDQQSVRREY